MNMDHANNDNQQQLKNKIGQIWGNLTEHEIASYENQRDVFFIAVKRKYGFTRAYAEGIIRELKERFYQAA